MQRSLDWYTRSGEERQIKRSDPVAVLGHVVVEHTDHNQVHAVLWNKVQSEDRAQ